MQKINKKGFTLIELLVVIAIIGLLSTLAVVSLNNARQKARDAKRISDVKQVQTALELFYNDQNGYPTQDGVNLGETGYECLDSVTGFDASADCSSGGGTIYMAQVPENPTPTDSGGAYLYNSETQVLSTNGEYSIEYYVAGDVGGVDGAQWNTACSAGISGCTQQ